MKSVKISTFTSTYIGAKSSRLTFAEILEYSSLIYYALYLQTTCKSLSPRHHGPDTHCCMNTNKIKSIYDTVYFIGVKTVYTALSVALLRDTNPGKVMDTRHGFGVEIYLVTSLTCSKISCF